MTVPLHTLDIVRQPAFILDAAGRIEVANDLAEAMAGRPLAGLSAPETARVFACRRPDGVLLEPAELPSCRALAGEEVLEEPLVVTAADGRTLTVLATASPIGEGGAVVGALVVWQDVTERARAEEALRRSEERLRDVLELSLDAVYRTDLLANRFDYISPVNETLTGFSAEEFGAFGLDEFQDRIHVEDQPKVKMIIAEAMRGLPAGTSGTVEYRFRHRDGSWRWLSDHFAYQTDPSGRLRYRVGVVRDVTRRHEIEAALREGEERLRLAQEGARIGTWDWEAATNRVTISPNFLRMYGLEEMAVSSYADFERMIDPDDQEQVWAAQLAVLASGAPMDLELRVFLPSGEVRWVQFKGQGMTDECGALARVIGVLIDVTDRKRAEAALAESEAEARSFFANMVDACAICETVLNEHGEPVDIRLVEVNPAFERALSLPARLIVGQTAFMILPALAREWFDLFLTVSRDRTFIEVEEPFPALDRWYHVTGFPTRHGRVAVVFRDITGHREAEDERVRFTEELQRSNEELQRFAYVASHDLQEPLRSIISFRSLLERRYKGRLDQDADEYIDFIVEGGNRMQTLIQDLLAALPGEDDGRPLDPTDAGEVVDWVLRAMETTDPRGGGTNQVGDLPVVMADAAQLAQVVANLISNALKYRLTGRTARIRSSAHVGGADSGGSRCSDNGIGIEPEYFDRIFVIFQRLHTKEAYPGTGIGLAVVKRIIDRHGGRVRVESTPGEGSTFFFTLPAA